MRSLDSSGSDTQLDCDIEKTEMSTADLSQQMQETEQKYLRRIAELELGMCFSTFDVLSMTWFKLYAK